MKKVLSIVLSIAMVVCLAPTMAFAGTTTAASNAAYSDIEGTACEGAVNVLSALGVVDGFTDGTYKPEQTVTRAQMAKLIVTALGLADYATAKTSKYVDMGTAEWAIPYVEYASNLNIVNGVGNGKFNPNGLVTYEQAATMIVRALGYTDECKEMNGTWPAIYVQKAMALGIFDDVTNGGANGATRGDIAIMLYNALELAQVYADGDGATKYKTGKDVAIYNGETISGGVTMMGILNKEGYRDPGAIVDDEDAENAVNNISGYIGASADLIRNKDNKVLALSNIKSTFVTGEFKSENTKFEADDKTYVISSKADIDSAVWFKNNVLSSVDNRIEDGKQYTIAVKISGKTITDIYSIAYWNVDEAKKVEDSDLNQITKNKKLLTVKFALDDDQEIDTASFILNGATSLSDIKADSVVYVYAAKDEVKRVDVGTKTVTGEITKVSGEKITINGTAYKVAAKSKLEAGKGDLKAGNEVTLILDYAGKIFDAELVEGNAGNFAVVLATTEDGPSKSNVSGTAKIELYTADGDKVFTVNGKKYVENADSAAWDKLTAGTIVKYSVNDAGEITKVVDMSKGDKDYAAPESAKDSKVSKAGYFDSYAVADNAIIFSVPENESDFNWKADTDDFAVVTKSSILNTEIENAKYIVDNDTNKIVFMIIDNGSTSDVEYGVITSAYDIKDGKGVDFYIDTEKLTDQEASSKTVTADEKVLYSIKKTTSGTYSFDKASLAKVNGKEGTASDITENTTVVKNGYVTVNGEKFNLYSNAIVYVYDEADKEWSIGSTSDLEDSDVTSIKLYSTDGENDDNYGLVNYIVITMK